MEIRDLQFFCLTAELEHVTRAADKLGVAQPFLTKIIGQLEKEVGVPLFDNVGRKIRLNSYGEIFYGHAKKMLAELEDLRTDMDAAIDRQERTVRLMTNLEYHYPEIVMAYQKMKPEYTLSISFASRKEILEALKTGEADYAICSPPLAADQDSGIFTEVIFCEQTCAMLPPGHPLLGRDSICFEDVVDDALVTTSKESALRINLDMAMERHDYHPQIVCESNDISMIIRTVKSGMGFSILPRTIMYSIPSIRKYCVESSLPDSQGEIAISYNTAPNLSREESGFAEFIKEYVREFFENQYTEQ